MVSIIVSIFNKENSLKKCVESILSQTYRDLEIILVDDGSTDVSSQMVDSYAKRDSRVIAIHQENAGEGGQEMLASMLRMVSI